MIRLGAECGITPAEFWEMTPYEFNEVVRAQRRKEERWERRFASVSATIMNMAGKSLKKGQTVSVDDLIESAPETSAERDHESEREYLRQQFNLRERGLA